MSNSLLWDCLLWGLLNMFHYEDLQSNLGFGILLGQPSVFILTVIAEIGARDPLTRPSLVPVHVSICFLLRKTPFSI